MEPSTARCPLPDANWDAWSERRSASKRTGPATALPPARRGWSRPRRRPISSGKLARRAPPPSPLLPSPLPRLRLRRRLPHSNPSLLPRRSADHRPLRPRSRLVSFIPLLPPGSSRPMPPPRPRLLPLPPPPAPPPLFPRSVLAIPQSHCDTKKGPATTRVTGPLRAVVLEASPRTQRARGSACQITGRERSRDRSRGASS